VKLQACLKYLKSPTRSSAGQGQRIKAHLPALSEARVTVEPLATTHFAIATAEIVFTKPIGAA
jgi:hypothetical protein